MPAETATAPDPAPAPVAPAELVARLGGRYVDDDYGGHALFDAAEAVDPRAGFVAALPDLGLLDVRGAEAAKFLHAQLTNDVEHLRAGEARWYGYCSPKGRLLSTSLGWVDGDGIALTVARPLAESLRRRLSMYVLRTKARVSDRSDDHALLGIGGARAPQALAALGVEPPAPMAVAVVDGLAVVGLPPVAVDGADAAVARWLLCVPTARLDAAWRTLAQLLSPAASTLWRWLEVRSGVARIVPATSERFVPQMVNFELVDGVSFRKGCYPGQEVVARSQYLGKLKRRMYRAHVDAPPPAPGSDVTALGGGAPAGQVVMAAPAPGGGAELLFEAQTAAVAGSLSVGEAPLRLEPLPYEVPA